MEMAGCMTSYSFDAGDADPQASDSRGHARYAMLALPGGIATP
jgi:hypothetical protein